MSHEAARDSGIRSRDQAVVGRFPELPGCASAGGTGEEAVANAKEALALWFEPSDVPLAEGANILEVAFREPAISGLHGQGHDQDSAAPRVRSRGPLQIHRLHHLQAEAV